jgi:hypothetical protein
MPPEPKSVPCGPRQVHAPWASEKLRNYMKKQGLNNRQFSERIGVSDRTIGRFLNTGNAKPTVLDDIADGMSITKIKLLERL